MTTARPRLSALPFPTVSVLTIYTTAPIPSEPHPPPNDSSNDQNDHGEGDKEDEQVAEMRKVVYWYSQHGNDLPVERKARLMGTIRGMSDFARMLSVPGGEGVRSVHSLRQRMVWLEVEKGWIIHATIDLPRLPKPSHPRTPSSASATDSAASPATLPLDDNALLTALARAYAQYRLQHGSLQSELERAGREMLVSGLEGWWSRFVEGWKLESSEPGAFERAAGGLPASPLKASASSQLDPLLSQFAATHSSAIPILLHRAQVLSLPTLSCQQGTVAGETLSSTASTSAPSSPSPSRRPPRAPPPPVTEADLAALVRYLADRVPPPLPPAPALPTSAAPDPSAISQATSASAVSSKWYHLGLSSFDAPSLPRVPSVPMPTLPSVNMSMNMTMPALAMPSMSLPSVSMPAMPTMSMPAMTMPGLPGLSGAPAGRGGEGAKAGGSPGKGGWGMRNVSWGTEWLKKGHKRSGSGLAKEAEGGTGEAEGAETGVGEQRTETANGQPEGAQGAAGVEVVPTQDAPGAEAAADAATLEVPDATVSNSVTPGSGTRSPATPAVKLADDVDPIALAEAMASMEALGRIEGPTEAGMDLTGAEATEKAKAELALAVSALAPPLPLKQVTEVFVGEEGERDTRAELWSFQHGDLTLGLITRPVEEGEASIWLESRSLRLLEAVESVVDGANSQTRPFPHPLLIKHGPLSTSHNFPSASPSASHWSGKPSPDTDDATAALFDALRHSTGQGSQGPAQPVVLESFVRLASGRWVVRQREEEEGAEELYLALEGRVGREGSLVEAAEEVRRVRRGVGA